MTGMHPIGNHLAGIRGPMVNSLCHTVVTVPGVDAAVDLVFVDGTLHHVMYNSNLCRICIALQK